MEYGGGRETPKKMGGAVIMWAPVEVQSLRPHVAISVEQQKWRGAPLDGGKETQRGCGSGR